MLDYALCQKCQSELAYWSVLPFHQAIRGCLLLLCESCLCDLVQDVAFGDKWTSVTAVTICRM